jgi:xylose isomerase
MTEYFPGISPVSFEGAQSTNPLAFRHYDPDAEVLGKPMRDHLRFAVCYWHTFRGMGSDMFGAPTFVRPWEKNSDPLEAAEETLDAAFEFFTKLGVGFWCFHDRDIAPEGDNLRETNKRLDHIVELAAAKQQETGIRLLWGTANLFSHPRFMAGAGTNPNPEIFVWAAAQVCKAIEVTHRLGGAGYVFWGGREGYDTLLNTNLRLEQENFARLLHMAVDYKKEIGFEGTFYIEPKPQEPTKHQYDYDAQSCHAFLQKHDLEKDFKLNIEANHATLAGHDFQHELAYSACNGLLGSVDANRGDLLCGWDTDQFPTDIKETTLAMYTILQAGGFTTGGLNFDAKVRRQSIDVEDLFHAHVGAMDAFAIGLKAAARLIEEGKLAQFANERYSGWESDLGKSIRSGNKRLTDLLALCENASEPQILSGRQEYLENILNDAIYS